MILLRCVRVIRGISIPCVVLFISRMEDAFGVVVPMPALPVAGNVFVCEYVPMIKAVNRAVASRFFFIVVKFFEVKFFEGIAREAFLAAFSCCPNRR